MVETIQINTKRGVKDKVKKLKKKAQQNSSFGTCLHTNFELKFPIIE